ncbi:WYL domain-containing protein [Celeribacter baekdonensis]|uniref:WYL domain-containing protein n=1 Tax=Celeribacter baekdonensis TaxID=875171 RepID=UPI0030DA39E2
MLERKKSILFGWIEACLRYGGTFGPKEKVMYQQTFGLSEPSTSRHQAEFADIFENAVGEAFCRNARNRFSGGRLTLSETAHLPEAPIFPEMPDIRTWLKDNLGRSGYVEEAIQRRIPESWIMRAVIQSIRSKTPLRITYHSRHTDGERTVSPHAIVHIVDRLHMRAYDHSKNEHRDFVLSRVTSATLTVDGQTFVGAEMDTGWNRMRTLVIEDRNDCVDHVSTLGIRLDYGLNPEGQRKVHVREALVQYLIDNMDAGYSPPVRIFEVK